MENADLLVRINQNFSSFSKGQRLLANYIMENYDKAAFVTASRMGHTVGVSESTVVRFAYALGYDGYPELQRAVEDAGPYECASAGFYLHMETIYEQAGGNSALAAQLLRPRHPRGGRLSPHLAIYRPESRPLGGG